MPINFFSAAKKLKRGLTVESGGEERGGGKETKRERRREIVKKGSTANGGDAQRGTSRQDTLARKRERDGENKGDREKKTGRGVLQEEENEGDRAGVPPSVSRREGSRCALIPFVYISGDFPLNKYRRSLHRSSYNTILIVGFNSPEMFDLYRIFNQRNGSLFLRHAPAGCVRIFEEMLRNSCVREERARPLSVRLMGGSSRRRSISRFLQRNPAGTIPRPFAPLPSPIPSAAVARSLFVALPTRSVRNRTSLFSSLIREIRNLNDRKLQK
ncbi:hypothetical protein PUN28_005724 [Cardiocondyla obscurior]|uniref:Uncharacterized protein n=1 Tax=Cardiocondyla obscurior TaxID=286306 RepID=A0AAW2G533_9HYME